MSSTSARSSIDIHGAPRLRTWTKLGATILPGSNTITTAEDVDWAVGDVLVVTTTELPSAADNATNQVEEVTVTAVLGPRQLQVDPPFTHTHISSWYTQPGFAPVDMRGEVALLSRNVVVQGDDTSESQLFGSHLAAMHGSLLRMSGTELRRCGQAFILGR
jgi:hypothetical protein